MPRDTVTRLFRARAYERIQHSILSVCSYVARKYGVTVSHQVEPYFSGVTAATHTASRCHGTLNLPFRMQPGYRRTCLLIGKHTDSGGRVVYVIPLPRWMHLPTEDA